MYFRILFIILLTSSAVASSHAATEGDRRAINDAYMQYQAFMAKGASARADAIEPAGRAYRLALEVYGRAHRNTAALAINYGNVLPDRVQAAQVLHEGLAMSELVYGNDAIELIDPLIAMGDVTTDLRDLTAARAHYSRALEIIQKRSHKDSFLEGFLLLSLGVTNYIDNKRLDAIKQFRTAREILAKHDTPIAILRRATAELWIGTYLVATNRYQEALEPLLASLAVFSAFPETHFTMLTTYKLLVETYEALEMRDAATNYVLAIGAITKTEPVLLYQVRPKRPTSFEETVHLLVIDEITTTAPVSLYEVKPSTMLRRESVVVNFTVDEQGYPRDASVVSSDNIGLNSTSLESILKMRYAPRFESGKAVETLDESHTFNFEPMCPIGVSC